MKELFLNVINNGNYDLKDMLNKIAERHINNDLTDEEKVELEEKAREKANPTNSYASLEERIEELFRRVIALEEANKVEEIPTEPSEEPEKVEEYPEYKQPLGSHDAYQTGDRISYNGKKYICVMNNCVWTPITYPAAWEVIE